MSQHVVEKLTRISHRYSIIDRVCWGGFQLVKNPSAVSQCTYVITNWEKINCKIDDTGVYILIDTNMHDSAFVMTSSNKCLDKNVPLYFYTSISVRPSREEKRFVSRLTPMNTNLPLKKMIARPPVERRMQLSWLGDTTIRVKRCIYKPPFFYPSSIYTFWEILYH